MSVVRENMLTQRGYTPYCGNLRYSPTGGNGTCSMPRTFFNGSQLECPNCGWKSNFEPEFIEEYKKFQEWYEGGNLGQNHPISRTACASNPAKWH